MSSPATSRRASRQSTRGAPRGALLAELLVALAVVAVAGTLAAQATLHSWQLGDRAAHLTRATPLLAVSVERERRCAAPRPPLPPSVASPRLRLTESPDAPLAHGTRQVHAAVDWTPWRGARPHRLLEAEAVVRCP